MEKKLVGLNIWLYTFSLNQADQMERKISKLANKGKVTPVYFDNLLAFEFRKNWQAY